ncbi:MAG: soluble lytic murein transglycosylase-like protein [Acidobacteria bacterium]|nr:soluble lytic murein transglycosylase-like protein [Acidobacteriota bacterium]
MKNLINSFAIIFTLVLVSAAVQAQVKEVAVPATGVVPTVAVEKRAELRQDFVKASGEYEGDLKKLGTLYADDLKKETEQNAKLKGLYADGLISRRDMEASDAAVAAARAKVDDTSKQVEQSQVAMMAAMNTPALDSALALTPAGEHIWTTGNKNVDNLINYYGGKYGVDPYLVYCVMHQESRFGSGATSNKGAMGLMQLMPGTAARYGVTNPYNQAQNIMGGTRYLKDLLALFGGRVDLVLAGYNAGEGAVMKYGNRVPPYAETKNYVRLISARYGQPLHAIKPIAKTVSTQSPTPNLPVSVKEPPAKGSGSVSRQMSDKL